MIKDVVKSKVLAILAKYADFNLKITRDFLKKNH